MTSISQARERLKIRYLDGIPAKIGVLRQALRQLRAGTDSDAEQSIRRLAHQIGGSAASFGFTELGALARNVESSDDAKLGECTEVLSNTLEEILQTNSPQVNFILVVDDDPAIYDLVASCATAPGRIIRHAQSVAAAKLLIDARDWQLIVLDLILPDGDGRDLLTALRSSPRTEDIPVVVLSAKGSSLVKNECAAYGIEAFMEKPLNLDLVPSVISSALERSKKLVREAYEDALTGISNRVGFRKVFSHAWAVSRRQDQELTIALIDLDHFKRFNDTYGHDVGDKVLAATGEVLSEVLRESDILGRWGGEEFVVAFPNTSANDAGKSLAKMANRLAETKIEEAAGETLTFSCGVVTMNQDEELDQGLLRADQLLYAAKRNGRNQILSTMPEADPHKPRILVAEDDPILARLILRELADAYEVTHAVDGAHAIQLAAENRDFDMVLLDFNMPKVDGLAVLKTLRQQREYKDRPILMLTAVSSDEIVEQAFSSGADDYIVKPYSRRALMARIGRHLLS